MYAEGRKASATQGADKVGRPAGRGHRAAGTALEELDAANRAAKTSSPGQQPTTAFDIQQKQAAVLEEARKLNYSKAIHMLKSTNVALGDVRDTETRLRALHPTEDVHTSAERTWPGVQPDAETFQFITGKWLDKQISKSKAGSATDQWGWDGRAAMAFATAQ